MKKVMKKIERFLEWGGLKKDVVLLVISGISLILSMFHLIPLSFDAAWIAIILCGIPIILVVFCPCALVLATPTAIMAAIGNATRHEFLVREGDVLERLAAVKRITFDKTGTLTYGTPKVTAIECFTDSIKESELLLLLAEAEFLSEHPLGKAVVCKAKENRDITVKKPESFSMIPGRGVSARVNGRNVLAGNPDLLSDHHIILPDEGRERAKRYLSEECTIIYVAVDGMFSGFVALADVLRESAGSVVRQIREMKICPVLLTGDNTQAATAIAGRLEITDVMSGCMPEDKLAYIEQSEHNRDPVCMIGDGINDAPALRKALVGIAMGGIGSDIAVDAADIVLIDDDIKELPHLLRLANHMMTVIRWNLVFSMTLNLIAIVLAITGILNPVVGALVHNAGSVFVILNSAILLRFHN